MILLLRLLQTPLAQSIGWTIFHSLWEGAAVALVLALTLGKLQSSRARYAAACLAMVAVSAAFIITFGLVLPEAIRVNKFLIGGPRAAILPLSPSLDLLNTATYFNAAKFLPWLAPFWIVGVILFHLRSLASWIGARRLRHRGVCAAPDFWQRKLTRLRAQAWVSKPVNLLESCLADVPVVIGHLRPVILVPLGMLSGLPAHQIEAILLHELAHIRRHDYLVNLLQTTIESFLFYHPAVWWISGTVRAERENCCDDFVVTTQGNGYEYAAALAALEQTRGVASQMVLAANGGNLMKRIHRLLYPLESPRSAITPILSAAILTITAAAALMAWQSQPVQPPKSVDAYQTWLNQDVAYIIDKEERAAFKKLTADDEREMFIKQFWERRDPTPGTVANEFKEEHYRRITYANSRYGSTSGLPGWKTDRGRVYITYGPPDEIESHPAGGLYRVPAEQGGGERSTYPFEQWRYNHIEGVGNKVIVEFVDTAENGEYAMTKDPNSGGKYIPR